MKLYFKKPITDSNKLKYLQFLISDASFSDNGYDYEADFKRGYIEIYEGILNNDMFSKLKALDIWEEKKIIGKFWISDENDYMIGIYGGVDEEGDHILIDSKGVGHRYSKNFKQITSLDDIN